MSLSTKEEVLRNVRARLEREQQNLRFKLERNKRTLADLTHEQTITKREIAKIGEILYGLDNA